MPEPTTTTEAQQFVPWEAFAELNAPLQDSPPAPPEPGAELPPVWWLKHIARGLIRAERAAELPRLVGITRETAQALLAEVEQYINRRSGLTWKDGLCSCGMQVGVTASRCGCGYYCACDDHSTHDPWHANEEEHRQVSAAKEEIIAAAIAWQTGQTDAS